MGKVDQKVLTLLDIDQVLTEQEISLVASPTEKTGHQREKSGKGKNPQGKDER
jgi:hypothetical protein